MNGAAPLTIAGAGPAGLSAAVTVARAGGRVAVAERHGEVGHRFHGDFQGLENWTTEGDVLEDLGRMGIEATFDHAPFREVVWFDAVGREYRYRGRRPFWYLVRRGTAAGTLDQALKAQATAAGADITFRTVADRLPEGGIVAHGPHRPDAIASGYVFDTDRADGAYGVAADRLAPKGYAYLLVWGGRGTVATCLFDDFHNERTYVERTLDFFREKVGLDMRNERPFGGFGNVFATRTARKGALMYVGEAAGFQDALFGFGMRYAITSGHLAARAWLDGRPATYDRAWRAHLGGRLRTGLVNRYLYERAGDRGYAGLMRALAAARDPRAWMRRYYAAGGLKALLYPIARRKFEGRRALVAGCVEGCTCTWCRCQGHAAAMARG